MIAGLPSSRIRELSAGEVLFRQGDVSTAIYRVERGRIRLERRTIEGSLVILHTGRPGELFAEASLFAPAYHCDATALEAARILVYPKAEVLRAIRGDPAGAERLLAAMAHQLQDARWRLELRNVRSARDRVWLWMDMKAGPDRVVADAGQLQDIAADLGLTRETLYRILSALERDGAIARDGRRITLRREVCT